MGTRLYVRGGIAVLVLSLCAGGALPLGMIGYAAAVSHPHAASAPPGLRLSESPSLVDVGDAVSFALSATSWPSRAGATLSFVSLHHGFTGKMQWDVTCSCFRIAVALARRIHPIEVARAKAAVVSGGTATAVTTTFQIRGLAPNGRDFAPGGIPSVTGWVSDPGPVKGEYEHFCAWVKTTDGLGVSGYHVQFVVHFVNRTQKIDGGVTGSSGIVCRSRQLGNPQSGIRVTVDVYANNLHTHTAFTPRS